MAAEGPAGTMHYGFVDDLDAWLKVTGVEDGDIAWYMAAKLPHSGPEDRDAFIKALTDAR